MQGMRRLLSLLVLLVPTASPAAASDWRVLRWGMDRAAIEAALGPALTVPDRPRGYGGGLSAPFFVEGAALGGLGFRAWLQLGPDGRLVQILFERRRGEAGPDTFAALLAGLEADWGAPDRSCAGRQRPGDTPAFEAVWRRAEVTAHAVLLDMAATGLPMRRAAPPPARVTVPAVPVPLEPPGPAPTPDRIKRPDVAGLPDPTAPVYPQFVPRLSPVPPPPALPERRATAAPAPQRAALPAGPRRILVRIHDPAAAALASSLCAD
jgi:hypothetical protein